MLFRSKGGYSVAIAGFITFLPFRSHNKRKGKKRSNDRFTIASINPKRTNIVVLAADQTIDERKRDEKKKKFFSIPKRNLTSPDNTLSL